MQLFALFFAANLVASAFAAPVCDTTTGSSTHKQISHPLDHPNGNKPGTVTGSTTGIVTSSTTSSATSRTTSSATGSTVDNNTASNTTAVSASCAAGSPSFLCGPQVGQGTYFDTGLGACGITNTDSDLIVAIPHQIFDSYPGYDGVNPNKNPVCGRMINAQYEGKSVTVKVTDRCGGCATATSLDFTPTAFSQLAPMSVGRLFGVTWTWV